MRISGYASNIQTVQPEAAEARYTRNVESQMRIVKNSKNSIVLTSLALNERIDADVVQELFDRNIEPVSRKLRNRGFTKA